MKHFMYITKSKITGELIFFHSLLEVMIHKYCFVMIFLLACGNLLYSQSVGISNDGSLPNQSAILDIKSSDKGLLAPRMSTAQRNAISNPANGLLVFDTNDDSFYVNSGSAASPNWVKLSIDNITSIGVSENTANSYQDTLKITMNDGNIFSTLLDYAKISKPQLGNGNFKFGPGGGGDFNKYIGVASYTEYLSETQSLHFRMTNTNTTSVNNIYWFEIRGFLRASNDNQSANNKMIHSIVGFGANASSIGGLMVYDYASPTTFSVYIGTDGYKYLKLTSDASLQCFLTVDTYKVSTGVLKHGDIEIIPSVIDF